MSSNKKFCTVGGYQMAYAEIKDGDEETLVFLHGNPTSSFLWRSIMAPLASSGRKLVAPDLIGMGDSDKLNVSNDGVYRFEQHATFLDGMLDCVLEDDEKITLVVHDWGSALGFWWAYRNQDRVNGIVYMEALVTPLTFDDFDPSFQQLFQALRSPGVGEDMILDQNVFVEEILPSAILRNLTDEEMEAYRAPFANPGEGRRPTLSWPREVPIDGSPANVVSIVETYSAWMAETDIPKLLVEADPGALLTGRTLEVARTWKNQVEVSVPGIHFIQEDSAPQIASAIEDFLESAAFESFNAQGETSAALAVSTPLAALWFFWCCWFARKLF